MILDLATIHVVSTQTNLIVVQREVYVECMTGHSKGSVTYQLFLCCPLNLVTLIFHLSCCYGDVFQVGGR